MKKENIIDIITDEDGRKIVVITDIRFKGKRNIDWEDVENYLWYLEPSRIWKER